jgi:hypothetical protein
MMYSSSDFLAKLFNMPRELFEDLSLSRPPPLAQAVRCWVSIDLTDLLTKHAVT